MTATRDGAGHPPPTSTMHCRLVTTEALRCVGGKSSTMRCRSAPPTEPRWDIMPDCVSGGREKDAHKWQQALAEAEHFVKHLCPEGGTVCDPFAGSGTSLLAAARLGRRYCGFEIDPETADRARARIQAESAAEVTA